MSNQQRLSHLFTVEEARAIQRFLRRMESISERGAQTAKAAVELRKDNYTVGQLEHWRKMRQAYVWARRLLDQSHFGA